MILYLCSLKCFQNARNKKTKNCATIKYVEEYNYKYQLYKGTHNTFVHNSFIIKTTAPTAFCSFLSAGLHAEILAWGNLMHARNVVTRD